MTVARPVNLWVEPFAGSAAVALALVGGSACIPPIGYMGGKRRDAPDILGAFGLRVGQGADHVVLVDAGPWGEAWEVIFDAELRAEERAAGAWRPQHGPCVRPFITVEDFQAEERVP